MSVLAALPDLTNELPLLSLSSVGTMIKNASTSSLVSTASSVATNAITGGVSGLFTIQNVVTVVGFIFLIIGLVTVTKLHKPIIAATKDAVKTASVAAVA